MLEATTSSVVFVIFISHRFLIFRKIKVRAQVSSLYVAYKINRNSFVNVIAFRAHAS